MARKPSHFGSKSQPFPEGSSSASFASIGSTGGSIGKRAVSLGPLASDRPVLRVLAMAPCATRHHAALPLRREARPSARRPVGRTGEGRDGPRGSSRRGRCRGLAFPTGDLSEAEDACAIRSIAEPDVRGLPLRAYLTGETCVKSLMIKDLPHSSM